MVHGSKNYITEWYSYKTVHVTKWYAVTKQYDTKLYIIIIVQYRNGLARR
jgi:hypothetical protein